jgi:poly-gamma-glutamate synthesis protein (capsule biosynthesis protein)
MQALKMARTIVAAAAAALIVITSVGCSGARNAQQPTARPTAPSVVAEGAQAASAASSVTAATAATGAATTSVATAGLTSASTSLTPSTTPRSPNPVPVSVAAVGDLLFDSAPKRLIQAEGGKAPFTKTASRLKGADVTVGNLECPLSNRGTPVPNKTFTFQGDPRAVQGLKYAGFDLLSLANNHARDYGGKALSDTFSLLRENGLPYAGAGKDRASAWRPAIIERNGVKIAYLAFSEITPTSFAATDSRSGTAYVFDFDKVRTAVRAANKQADYVIVSFHWGIERRYQPTSRQVSEGRAVARDGADLVLSHHPHVIQGVEFYRGKLIAYSLGNFVFSPGSDAGRDSMILHATMTSKGVRAVSAEPVWIGHNGRPVPATGTAASRILGTIKKTSSARGTTVKVVEGKAQLTP